MTMDKIIASTSRCALLVISMVTSGSLALDLTILHTNDFHSRIEQTSTFSSACSAQAAAEGACFGGVARLHTQVQNLRNTPRNLLLLDGGDQFQGSLWFNYYKGLAAAHFMNRNRYDAMTLGNHEFDLGAEGLAPFLQNVTFPVLSCNLDTSSEPLIDGLYQPSTVLTVDGERVGIVGYTVTETKFLVLPEGIRNIVFNDEVTSIQQEVDNLIGSGINKVIVLGHGGYLLDQRIAREVTGVDIVVGGHSNSFLYTGDPDNLPSNEDAVGPYPTVVTQGNGAQVLVVQAYAYGKYLGFLDVTFGATGELTEWSGNPILLDGSIAQDPVILAEVETWAEPLVEVKNAEVGETSVFLEARPLCRLSECGIASVVCEALLLELMVGPQASGEPWTDVSLVMINGGGMRAATEQGTVTMGQVLSVLPFRNEAVRITLRGSTILQALQHSANNWKPADPDGAFLQFSGFRVVYDVTRELGDRVVSVEVRCQDCIVPSFSPLEAEREYNVLTNNFLASGGDGYSMIRDNILEMRDYGILMSDALANYLRKRSPLIQGIDGRITVITEPTVTSPPTVTTETMRSPRPAPPHTTEYLGTPLPPSGSTSVFVLSSAEKLVLTFLSVILARIMQS